MELERGEVLDLKPLMSPRSIAIIGASAQKGGWGYANRLVENIIIGGFNREMLYLVNPKYDRIGDMPCYHDISTVPGPVDLAVIIIAGNKVSQIIEECIRLGVKAALVISAGFSEAGEDGRDQQSVLRDIARNANLLVCGPNALGVVNPGNSLMLHAFMNLKMNPGNIGLISQSGAAAFSSIIAPALDRGIYFSKVATTGNEAVLESIDFIRYMVDEPDTKVICCFIEGFKEAGKIMVAAEDALRAGKPILMVKVGRSELGAEQAISHTGAMTGTDRVYQAIFEQKNIIRLEYPEDLYETANVFANCPAPVSEGVAIISTSGGMGSLLADMCSINRIELPELSHDFREYIKTRDYLLFYGEPVNPLDIRGQGASHLPDIVKPFASDDRFGLLVIVLGISAVGPLSVAVANSLKKIAEDIDKPLIVLWVGKKIGDNGGASEKGYKILEDNNIPVFYSTEKLVRGVKQFITYYKQRNKWLAAQDDTNRNVPLNIDREEALEFLKGKSGTLHELESRRLLSFYGIPTPKESLAESLEDGISAANKIGFPVVVKVVSEKLPHKTEAGAVRLNIGNEGELKNAWNDMIATAQRYCGELHIQGVLIQEMITGAREMMVGITQDKQFGPVVVCGLGGVFTEVFKDIKICVPPICVADVREMVDGLKALPLLQAFRGKKPADLDSLYDVILRVGQMAIDLRGVLNEMDINPLLVKESGNGVVAVDTMVALCKQGHGT